jgi:hypothetical protein
MGNMLFFRFFVVAIFISAPLEINSWLLAMSLVKSPTECSQERIYCNPGYVNLKSVTFIKLQVSSPCMQKVMVLRKMI